MAGEGLKDASALLDDALLDDLPEDTEEQRNTRKALGELFETMRRLSKNAQALGDKLPKREEP